MSINSFPFMDLQIGSLPPLWGGYETWSCKVNMTNPADSLEHPEWNFDYFFDQPNDRELYIQKAGQGDEVCKKIAADAEEVRESDPDMG